MSFAFLSLKRIPSPSVPYPHGTASVCETGFPNRANRVGWVRVLWGILLSGILVTGFVGCQKEEREQIEPGSREFVVVPDDVSTITEAISCVVVGGEVRIREGRYREPLRIVEDVHLVGLGDRDGIILTSESQPTVVSTAAEVSMENLTIHYGGTDRVFAGDVTDPLKEEDVSTAAPTVGATSQVGSSQKEESQVGSDSKTDSDGENAESDTTIPVVFSGRDQSKDPSGVLSDTEPRAAVVLHRGTLTMRECEITATWANGIVADGAETVLELSQCELNDVGQIGLKGRSGVAIRLEQCGFNGNRLGVVCNAASEAVLRQVEFQRSSRIGALFHRTPTTLTNCRFRDSATGLELSDVPPPAETKSTETNSAVTQDNAASGNVADGNAANGSVANGNAVGDGTNSVVADSSTRRSTGSGLRFSQCNQSLVLKAVDAEFVDGGVTGGGTGILTQGGTGVRIFREWTLTGVRTAIRSEGQGDLFDQCRLESDGGLVGVWLERGAKPVFQRCEIRGYSSDAIRITTGAGGTFVDCTLESPEGGRCVNVDEDCAPNFQKTRMSGGGSEVVRVESKEGMVLENCEISGGDIGIHVASSGNPQVRGQSRIFGNRKTGVQIDASGSGQFEDCAITDNGHFAMTLGASSTAVFSRCELRGGDSGAVRVDPDGSGTLVNCRMTGPSSGYGVLVQRNGNPTLRECVIEQRERVGIMIADQGRGTFENCQIRDCAIGIQTSRAAPTCTQVTIQEVGTGIQLQTRSTGTFTDCRLENVAETGVRLTSSTAQLYNTTFSKCGKDGVSLSDTSRLHLADCKILDGNGNGVQLRDRSQVRMDRCTVRGNQGIGVSIGEGSQLTQDAESVIQANIGGDVVNANVGVPQTESMIMRMREDAAAKSTIVPAPGAN